MTSTFKVQRNKIRAAFAPALAQIHDALEVSGATCTAFCPGDETHTDSSAVATADTLLSSSALPVMQIALRRAPSTNRPTLESLGIDSLSSVQLRSRLRRQSTLSGTPPTHLITDSLLPVADAAGPMTTRHTADFVQPDGRAASAARSISLAATAPDGHVPIDAFDQFWQDLQTPLDFMTETSASSFPSAELPALTPGVFLTGATGFLGAHVLHTLMATHTFPVVYCLVRGEEEVSGGATSSPDSSSTVCMLDPNGSALLRLQQSLRHRHLWRAEWAARIVAVDGTLDAPLFGLKPQMWLSLASATTCVVHAAAFVNWLAPYPAMRATNVLGVVEMVRFAVASAPARFIHVSTVSATLAAHGEAVPSFDSLDSSTVRNWFDELDAGYNQSKFVGDMLVSRAAAMYQCRDRWLIFRPGMIGGHSVTGLSEPAQFVPRYLLTVLQTGFFVACTSSGSCNCSALLELIPVDWTAAAIVLASGSSGQMLWNVPRPAGGCPVYHLVNRAANCLSFCQIGHLWAELVTAHHLSRGHSDPDSHMPFQLRPVNRAAFAQALTPQTALWPLRTLFSQPRCFEGFAPRYAAARWEEVASTMSSGPAHALPLPIIDARYVLAQSRYFFPLFLPAAP
jgi:thioester reductase-like protein